MVSAYCAAPCPGDVTFQNGPSLGRSQSVSLADSSTEQKPCWRFGQTVTGCDTTLCFVIIFQSDSPLGKLTRLFSPVVLGTAVVPTAKYLTKQWELAVKQMQAPSIEVSFRL